MGAWVIVDGPVEDLYPPGGLDAVTWAWEIERDTASGGRSSSENARTLEFRDHGFEKE